MSTSGRGAAGPASDARIDPAPPASPVTALIEEGTTLLARLSGLPGVRKLAAQLLDPDGPARLAEEQTCLQACATRVRKLLRTACGPEPVARTGVPGERLHLSSGETLALMSLSADLQQAVSWRAGALQVHLGRPVRSAQETERLAAEYRQLVRERGRLIFESQDLSAAIRRKQALLQGPGPQGAARHALFPGDQALLEALRERDAARETVLRLETRLAAQARPLSEEAFAPHLTVPSNRERYALLVHAMGSAAARAGVLLDYRQASDLDYAQRDWPVVTHTWRGTPVKRAEVQGKTIYLLLTPDTSGELTLTTVYTEEMLRRQGAF